MGMENVWEEPCGWEGKILLASNRWCLAEGLCLESGESSAEEEGLKGGKEKELSTSGFNTESSGHTEQDWPFPTGWRGKWKHSIHRE